MTNYLYQAKEILTATVKNLAEQKSKWSETGERHNIFNVLNLTTNENRHSLFLANLLNPNGSHDQGDCFLSEFIEVVGDIESKFDGKALREHLEEFSKSIMSVTTELSLGPKGPFSGGRVDIALIGVKQRILVKNKIYAGLQERQLERYLAEGNPVIFLTLFDDDYNEHDAHELLYRLNYKSHIFQWIERCMVLVESIPAIFEVLKQYLSTLEQLTGRKRNTAMKEELLNLVTKDKEHLNAYFELVNSSSIFYEAVWDKITEDCKEGI